MKEISGRIRCSGTFHTVGIDQDGRPFMKHHDRDEIAALKAAAVIGGMELDVPCLKFVEEVSKCLRGKMPEPRQFPAAIADFLIRREAERIQKMARARKAERRRVRYELRSHAGDWQ